MSRAGISTQHGEPSAGGVQVSASEDICRAASGREWIFKRLMDQQLWKGVFRCGGYQRCEIERETPIVLFIHFEHSKIRQSFDCQYSFLSRQTIVTVAS